MNKNKIPLKIFSRSKFRKQSNLKCTYFNTGSFFFILCGTFNSYHQRLRQSFHEKCYKEGTVSDAL